MASPKKLGEILVDLRVLSSSQVEQVLIALQRRTDRQKFGQVARDMGYLREEFIWAALAVQMNLFPGIQALNLADVMRILQSEMLEV